MALNHLIGDKEVLKILNELPKNITKSAVNASGRKAARPIVKEARSIIRSTSTKTKGNLDGFEHLRALSKMIKSVTTKAGVNVQFKGSDIPIGSGYWNVWGVANLFAFGRKVNKGTGTTEGFGNWVQEAAGTTRGLAYKIFYESLETEVGKAIDRTMKKHGKRYAAK